MNRISRIARNVVGAIIKVDVDFSYERSVFGKYKIEHKNIRC